MNNNSKVLALKYRPTTFKNLIGQEIIAETIYNSIKNNRSANAYLFTGIRGVGKTTIARIIAKSLNCLKGIDELCSKDLCENCKAISNSNHIDVLEMDAASKTGVDDVRDLIEFSRYGPTTAKYKIFIIDEVHMLSKQAFNALLKTLEEPPEYLKFIFATTEVKKIPVTVISRCQRFDLARVSSSNLFKFIKEVKDKEKGKIKDEALKLIVKISEGSVRDALSLLDRALLSQNQKSEIDLKEAQKIFGFFDKSYLINLFKFLFKGDEKEVINIYRSIYNQGVEPKLFLNDFLEILYYIKNISSIKLDGNFFSLNDEEFIEIELISKEISPKTLLLFWQFTIKTLSELNIVSNQNLSMEMFLIRLLYLKEDRIVDGQDKVDFNNEKYSNNNKGKTEQFNLNKDEDGLEIKNKTISQIKNFSQEESSKPEKKIESKLINIEIKNFEELIKLCNEKKELKLKYELETHVSLVSFIDQRIEISFNENLDKDFVKELTFKLHEWTGQRWIIAFSKEIGQLSKKQKIEIEKSKIIENAKSEDVYKKVLDLFPDAELVDVKLKDNE
ncbi:MAG: DNA polymerase III subunit gamma/tau [Pelagibacterales bacterium]|nr:DNA polymerase III subunit gamma/tau [Pelagibacterales bacterium]